MPTLSSKHYTTIKPKKKPNGKQPQTTYIYLQYQYHVWPIILITNLSYIDCSVHHLHYIACKLEIFFRSRNIDSGLNLSNEILWPLTAEVLSACQSIKINTAARIACPKARWNIRNSVGVFWHDTATLAADVWHYLHINIQPCIYGWLLLYLWICEHCIRSFFVTQVLRLPWIQN